MPGAEFTIHIDGASRGNPGPASVGIKIRDGKKTVAELSESLGVATNNVAEYFALIYALQEAAVLGAKRLQVFTDSELLARQFSGQYKVKDPTIRLLHRQVRHLLRHFEECKVSHVPREENTEADRLANEALDRELF